MKMKKKLIDIQTNRMCEMNAELHMGTGSKVQQFTFLSTYKIHK